MKKVLFVALSLMVAFGAYLSMGTIDNAVVSAPDAEAGKKFSGTVYVAGHGGHFAVADITASSSGLKVNKLTNMSIETGDAQYIFHDARIDSEDNTKIFWSTYKPTKGAPVTSAQIGVSDLKTGKVLKDVTMPILAGTSFAGALYCGSGQSKDNYMPMTMTKRGYLDVFDKKTLKHKHRIFVEDIDKKLANKYIFLHGNTNADQSVMMVSINGSKKWGAKGGAEFGKRSGIIYNYLLDVAALDKGKVKVLAKNTVTGSKKKTFTFRQTFTPNGKYVIQSGADRTYVLDGKTLKLKRETMMKDGENHDAVTGPNNKYAVLTLRTSTKDAKGKSVKDGALQLYDIKKGKTVGKPVSVCNACHKGDLGDNIKAVLCGADANWK